MSEFGVWLSTVLRVFAALVTGGIVIALLWVISVYFKRPIPRWVNMTVIVISLIYALFTTWQVQHKRALKAEALANDLARTYQEDLQARAPQNPDSPNTQAPAVVDQRPAKPHASRGISEFVGHWSGSFQCSKHNSDLDWRVLEDGSGNIQVFEKYVSYFPWPVGTRRGNVSYTGAVSAGKLAVETRRSVAIRRSLRLRQPIHLF